MAEAEAEEGAELEAEAEAVAEAETEAEAEAEDLEEEVRRRCYDCCRRVWQRSQMLWPVLRFLLHLLQVGGDEGEAAESIAINIGHKHNFEIMHFNGRAAYQQH